MHAMMHEWRSEDNLWDLVLFFYHGGPGMKLGYQALQQVPLLGEAISLALGL